MTARPSLVTGGAGFIGSAVVSDSSGMAIASGCSTTDLAVTCGGSPGSSDAIDYVEGDVRDPAVVARSLRFRSTSFATSRS